MNHNQAVIEISDLVNAVCQIAGEKIDQALANKAKLMKGDLVSAISEQLKVDATLVTAVLGELTSLRGLEFPRGRGQGLRVKQAKPVVVVDVELDGPTTETHIPVHVSTEADLDIPVHVDMSDLDSGPDTVRQVA